MQWKDHVHLHPIDVNYEELKLMNDGNGMNPALLDNKALRKHVVPAYYKFMKKVAEVSNQNLIRNSDAYLHILQKVEKLIQTMNFSRLTILIDRPTKIAIGLLIFRFEAEFLTSTWGGFTFIYLFLS